MNRSTSAARKVYLENLNQKVDRLSNEPSIKKALERCTRLERQKISVIINEIKYDANRIKNMI